MVIAFAALTVFVLVYQLVKNKNKLAFPTDTTVEKETTIIE